MKLLEDNNIKKNSIVVQPDISLHFTQILSTFTCPQMNQLLQWGYPPILLVFIAKVKTMDFDIFIIHSIIPLDLLKNITCPWEISWTFYQPQLCVLKKQTHWYWLQKPPIDNPKTLLLHVHTHQYCLLLLPHKNYMHQ